MLCSKFKQIALYKSTLHNNVQIRYLLSSRDVKKKWVWIDGLLASVAKSEKTIMSPIRIIIKDLRVWSIWTRRNIVGTVIRRCSRDRGVREVIQCFRQAFFRPKRTLLISATAAYKARCDDDDNTSSCEKSITDAELQDLLKDMDAVEMLSRRTLFCTKCGMRLVIDKKQPGVRYCSCKSALVSENAELGEGWVPYMEAEDVVIWRKEYKPGLGLYAYKVYGRYPEVQASDFAAIQVDGAYRRVWDAAVAALAVVERGANGLPDQAILHWEVLWPRLFANRDYVYIRRHKQFDVTEKSLPHKEGLFQPLPAGQKPCAPIYTERPSVHSNAKRKAVEMYERERDADRLDNKVYVILNRSCDHPDVPETKHAIRVTEYWSHMVVKTMNGPDKNGMEFVLTYYDEPAVGGMPSSVASWATGRAAPAYLQRMRRAASEYRAWREAATQEIPDFTPFAQEKPTCKPQDAVTVSQEQEVVPVIQNEEPKTVIEVEIKGNAVQEEKEIAQELKESGEGVKEELESPDNGIQLELEPADRREQATQTEEAEDARKESGRSKSKGDTGSEDKSTEDKSVSTEKDVKHDPVQTDGDAPKCSEEEESKNGGWWRNLYPFYYFV